ncbi:hypothetical protein [Rickettsia endosymbiont of Cardiosporidium cionae]|uniref:hypothetical protein n=1 Tax=Rickettsia endosymbiont of Cardiosporidium cionae TaxID=2777155 RepID=UPI0018937693|nr:hypothetical protein [Rickettsia endosymbiont of Cardiosporidium cionae]KAF8818317.1 hypothetical protein IHI24_000777 [Rickettsia endosymbiont of Cardiosporidium cionae]
MIVNINQSKKYFSIKELSSILSVSCYHIQKLERLSSHLKIVKIKNRKYYTQNHILYFQEVLRGLESDKISYEKNRVILTLIDKLVKKFSELLN